MNGEIKQCDSHSSRKSCKSGTGFSELHLLLRRFLLSLQNAIIIPTKALDYGRLNHNWRGLHLINQY